MVCPECGCRDLRTVHIDKKGKSYLGPLDIGYVFPRDVGRERKYWDVLQCFKCGWREETPWEVGKRMANESRKELGLGLEEGGE